MKYKFAILSAFCLGVVILWGVVGCQDFAGDEETIQCRKAVLKFSWDLNEDVYSKSYFKKPPQFAVWLEDESDGTIRTVWVTYGTGSGDWGEGIVRPVSLPYWVSRWNRETQSSGDPTPDNRVVDAVTGATPRAAFEVEALVESGRAWKYFIEVNVSGDFNDTYLFVREDGEKDEHGNGQPSIIYQGKITSLPGKKSIPELAGRTEQWRSVDHIIGDLEGITTAKDLLTEIKVSCEASGL